jgi:23S rRNA pseudouridine2605 synthase
MESGLDRTYNLKLDKPITEEMITAMKEGLVLDDARAGGHEKSKIYSMEFAPFAHFEIRAEGKNFSKLRVTITEGKNRELRRFFAHFEAKVLDLKRVAFGGIELDNLPTNKTRFFTRREYDFTRREYDDVHKFMKRKKENEKADIYNKVNAKKQEEENKREKEYQKNKALKQKKFNKQD